MTSCDMFKEYPWLESVYSDGSSFFVSNPLPKKGERVTIAMRLLEDAPVRAVFLRAKINGVEEKIKMRLAGVFDGLARYEADVTLYEDELRYQFYIAAESCVFYYTEAGITTFIQGEAFDFRLLTGYQQPEWVKSAVFYQIFPERFCNGNPENDVREGEYTFDGYPARHIDDWNAEPKDYAEVRCLDFYGGDLEGVEQKLPYLKRLGISAIYLNPIFYAATVHKYDCLDYFQVDPHFGGDAALSSLIEKAHGMGIKVILDVSINHTGIAHKWFNRDGTFFPKTVGAYNNPDAPEREYYFFGEGNTYKAWAGVKSLPTLNYTSSSLRDVLYRSEDSLVKKWLKPPFNADGWRFDVADTMARNNEIQLHHEVWPEIRQSIKEENPQAYILAEDWTDCADFLNGNEWDSPMNYFGCARPLREFCGETDLFNAREPLLASERKMTAADLAARITENLSRIPFALRQVQFNLLDSHDTPRLHNNPAVSKGVYRGAVIALFTLPGCCSIYYGDEAEIEGRIDSNEGCRYPMPWGKDFEGTETWALYSSLAKIKRSSPAFSDGGFRIAYAEGRIFAFARFTPDELYFTVISGESEARRVSLPLSAFGAHFAKLPAPTADALGTPLSCEISGGRLLVDVPAEGGLLIQRLGLP